MHTQLRPAKTFLKTKKRIMYKVGGISAVPGTLVLMSGTVLAAASKDEPTAVQSIDELSLYTTPRQKLRYVEPEVGQLEQGVTALRKATEPYATWCQQTTNSAKEKVQGVYGKVKPKVDCVVQCGQDSYEYLKDPPSEFYPRTGLIGFAGIMGLYLARGSRVKKLIYPTGLVAVGASMYYPQHAAEIAKNTGDNIYDWALQAYVAMEKLVKGPKLAPKPLKEKAEKPEEKSPSEEARA